VGKSGIDAQTQTAGGNVNETLSSSSLSGNTCDQSTQTRAWIITTSDDTMECCSNISSTNRSPSLEVYWDDDWFISNEANDDTLCNVSKYIQHLLMFLNVIL
jgi:hypothetical protein